MHETEPQTYAFFYFMQGTSDEIDPVVPRHIQYWEGLELRKYSGGPFSDFSGGMIVFQAKDDDEAQQIVAEDPFVLHDLLDQSWLKGWQVQ